jgi:hypothetical protein
VARRAFAKALSNAGMFAEVKIALGNEAFSKCRDANSAMI